jgi:hypothetical protein
MRRRSHRRGSFRPNRRGHRRLRRNPDWMREVVVPVAGGTAGFIAARVLGNVLANQSLPVIAGNPNASKVVAAVVGIPLASWASTKVDIVRENLGAIILGMGMAPVEGYLRNLPILGGGPMISMPSTPVATATPPVTSTSQSPNAVSTSGLSDYYTAGMMGLGTGMDVSHFGAPYQGMLGVGDADGAITNAENADSSATTGGPWGSVPSVSITTPTDAMAPIHTEPYAAPMTETMSSPGGRGYAGGLFSRMLFNEGMEV